MGSTRPTTSPNSTPHTDCPHFLSLICPSKNNASSHSRATTRSPCQFYPSWNPFASRRKNTTGPRENWEEISWENQELSLSLSLFLRVNFLKLFKWTTGPRPCPSMTNLRNLCFVWTHQGIPIASPILCFNCNGLMGFNCFKVLIIGSVWLTIFLDRELVGLLLTTPPTEKPLWLK